MLQEIANLFRSKSSNITLTKNSISDFTTDREPRPLLILRLTPGMPCPDCVLRLRRGEVTKILDIVYVSSECLKIYSFNSTSVSGRLFSSEWSEVPSWHLTSVAHPPRKRSRNPMPKPSFLPSPAHPPGSAPGWSSPLSVCSARSPWPGLYGISDTG